jgi:MATE family multidrug resistance protein
MLTVCSQLIFAAIFILFHHVLPRIYVSDPEVIATASSLLILAALFQLSDGFQVVGVGILRGLQDVRVPSFLAFASYWIVMVPVSYFLAFDLNMKVNGIWIGFVIGLSVAAVLMYIRFRVKLRHLEFADL